VLFCAQQCCTADLQEFRTVGNLHCLQLQRPLLYCCNATCATAALRAAIIIQL
jgi:hypothetical protein